MHTASIMVIAALTVTFTIVSGTVRAEEQLLPKDMAYIGQGGSMMGLDREESVATGKKLTLYERRMKAPWSAEALNDESPAHMVFLDPYFIDRYEVSNKDYGEFIKARRRGELGGRESLLRIPWQTAADGSGVGKGCSRARWQSLSLGQYF